MTLKDDVKKVQAGIVDATKQVLPVNRAPNVTPARSYPSPSATYQEDSQFINPFDRSNVTFRPMWKVEETALQQRKVTTTTLPPVSQTFGISVAPSTTSATLVAVPDLTISFNHNGSQAQFTWSISASLSSNLATASFQLFHDGVALGPILYGQSVANNQKFTASSTWIDSLDFGQHTVSLYWATSSGTLTADGKNRVISVLLLRPQ